MPPRELLDLPFLGVIGRYITPSVQRGDLGYAWHDKTHTRSSCYLWHASDFWEGNPRKSASYLGSPRVGGSQLRVMKCACFTDSPPRMLTFVTFRPGASILRLVGRKSFIVRDKTACMKPQSQQGSWPLFLSS